MSVQEAVYRQTMIATGARIAGTGSHGDNNGKIRCSRLKITARKSTNSSLYRRLGSNKPISVVNLSALITESLSSSESQKKSSSEMTEVIQPQKDSPATKSVKTTVGGSCSKPDTADENESKRGNVEPSRTSPPWTSQKRSSVGNELLNKQKFLSPTLVNPPKHTYSRMNGQIHTGVRVLRSLKPKRALILERSVQSPAPDDSTDVHQMSSLPKENRLRNALTEAVPPLPSSGSSSSLPKVKRTVDEVLQNIPANMANSRSVPLVVLKPVSGLNKLLQRISSARSIGRGGNVRQPIVSYRRVKSTSVASSCRKGTTTKQIGAPVLKKSPVKENHVEVMLPRIKEEPMTPPEIPEFNVAAEEESWDEDPSTSGECNNAAYLRNLKSPKRTCRNDDDFLGKYAYMVGKKVADPVKVTRRLSSRVRRFGKRTRNWTKRHWRKRRLSCPDIDVIEGMEFLSFESEDDLQRFIRNNPGRVCKGPAMSSDATRPRSVLGQVIVPTKTDDITKIKGWRNKIFDPEAISKLELLFGNFGRQESRSIAYEKPLVSLPGCSNGASTSTDNYVDRSLLTDAFYDGDTKDDVSMNWICDYGDGNNEASVFDDVLGEHDDDDDDAESIKSIDLGILSSEYIAEELRRRGEDQNVVDGAHTISPAPSSDSFAVEDSNNRAISNPNIKSAFVSDFLDDFLKNQSELKVKIPEPMYVSPDDIDTKVVWPSHEMAVLDQVPPIPDGPQTVHHPAFRQRRVTRPGDSIRGRPRLRGRPRKPRSEPPSNEIASFPRNTIMSKADNWHMKISLTDAVFAVTALDSGYIWDKQATLLASPNEINRTLNQHAVEPQSPSKEFKKKSNDFSVVVLPFEAELAASAVMEVEPRPAKKSVEECDPDEDLNAWERFLRTTSNDRETIRRSQSSPNTASSLHEEETPPVCDSTAPMSETSVSISEAVCSGIAESMVGDCEKEFCHLGCVCDSLKVRKRRRGHCGKVQCMFSCSCNPFEGRKASSGKTKVLKAEEEIQPPKRRRQIRIPERLKDSVYFFSSKTAETAKEEKYNKYKMKTKQKPHSQVKPRVKFVERPPGTPLRTLKPKAISNEDFCVTLSKLSATELAAYSNLGYPKIRLPVSSAANVSQNASNKSKLKRVRTLTGKRDGLATSNPAIVSRLQEPSITSPPSTPVKPGRLEFTLKPIVPIIRPASSRSIPTILRRSGAQNARKSLNPSALYRGVPSQEQSQTGTVGLKQVVESSEQVDLVVKNMLDEMTRKIAFHHEIYGGLQSPISNRARMSCFQTVSSQGPSKAAQEPATIRFPWLASRLNMDRREKNESVCSTSTSSTEKSKLTKAEKEQNRRKALRLAFTHLAMVACPVVKDMWSQRNHSFSITAFVFRMACTAIGRLRQQEKKLLLSKQSLIRERMELFNKYTEYLKGVDPNKQKETIKELAVRLQDCCKDRKQRNKNSVEQQKKMNLMTVTSVQSVTREGNKSVAVTDSKSIRPADVSKRLSLESGDDIHVVNDLPETVSGKCSDSNSNLSVGDPIGKVGNKPILLGDSVLIGGTYAAKLRSLDDFQDSSVKTIRVQTAKGGTRWIPLSGNCKDSKEHNTKESNVSVAAPITKLSTLLESNEAIAALIKKQSTLKESNVFVAPAIKKQSTLAESNDAVSALWKLYVTKKTIPPSVSIVKPVEKSSTATKLIESVPALQKKLVVPKNLVSENFERSFTTVKANNSILLPVQKPAERKDSNVMEALFKRYADKKPNEPVAVPVTKLSASKPNVSMDGFIKKASAAAPVKNPTVAIRFSNSDVITYLPTKTPLGGYITVADLLQRAQQTAKNKMTATTCTTLSTSNLNGIDVATTTKRGAVITSLKPATAVGQVTLLKSMANGDLLSVPSIISVVPTPPTTSNRTISVAASAGSASARLVSLAAASLTNAANKTTSNDGTRFVVIKPKPFPVTIEQRPSLSPSPPPLPREELVASPIDDTPLNIEDVPKHKRNRVAILLRQQRDAARAAAAAVASCELRVPTSQTTLPQPVNAFVATPVAVPAISIGVDGIKRVQRPSSEMPKMLFSPITEDDFLLDEDEEVYRECS